jgi:dihydrofolate synthase/folylpolyglutamate synthase
VEILELLAERVESVELIQKALIELEIEYSTFKSLKSDKKYLVFGSFSVVETFLREYNG